MERYRYVVMWFLSGSATFLIFTCLGFSGTSRALEVCGFCVLLTVLADIADKD